MKKLAGVLTNPPREPVTAASSKSFLLWSAEWSSVSASGRQGSIRCPFDGKMPGVLSVVLLFGVFLHCLFSSFLVSRIRDYMLLSFHLLFRSHQCRIVLSFRKDFEAKTYKVYHNTTRFVSLLFHLQLIKYILFLRSYRTYWEKNLLIIFTYLPD